MAPRALTRGDPALLDAQTPRVDARDRGREIEEEEEELSTPLEPWILDRFPALVHRITVDQIPPGTTWADVT